MWRKIESKSDIANFTDLIKSAHSAYSKENVKSTKDCLLRLNAEHWIFSQRGSTYSILMSFYMDTKTTGRVLIAIPSGVYIRSDLNFISRTMIRKARDYMDRYGVEFFNARTLDDYENDLLNDLYQGILPGLMHEFERGDLKFKQKPGDGSYKMKFQRRSENKKNDEQFKPKARPKPKRKLK